MTDGKGRVGVMDQRSENRHREHAEQPDHHLTNTGRDGGELQPGKTLHECICGWVGWITPKLNLTPEQEALLNPDNLDASDADRANKAIKSLAKAFGNLPLDGQKDV